MQKIGIYHNTLEASSLLHHSLEFEPHLCVYINPLCFHFSSPHLKSIPPSFVNTHTHKNTHTHTYTHTHKHPSLNYSSFSSLFLNYPFQTAKTQQQQQLLLLQQTTSCLKKLFKTPHFSPPLNTTNC